MNVDPSGHNFILAMAIGFGIGYLIGGGFEIGKQVNSGGWNPSDWNWGQIGLSDLGGGVANVFARGATDLIKYVKVSHQTNIISSKASNIANMSAKNKSLSI